MGSDQAHDRGQYALLTDLYQLTMAFGYWKTGWEEKEAVFNLTFRNNPFGGGFSIACGLASVIEFLDRYAFSAEEIDYLETLTGNDGRPIFHSDFLRYLGRLKLTCEVDGFPEGALVFPHEPLLRVRGPIIQCQLLETTLLNILNFQSLIATKAARVCLAANGDPVLEFGLRRAQGSDGGLTASRAAYIGGCAGTSNLLAGKRFGIPVRGTHAHSWVMAFGNELESFEAYARALPNNCVFLVDTYDSLEGVRNAVRVGKQTATSRAMRWWEFVSIQETWIGSAGTPVIFWTRRVLPKRSSLPATILTNTSSPPSRDGGRPLESGGSEPGW